MGTELRKHLYLSLKQIATLSVFKQQLKRLAYRVKTAGPVVASATVATTTFVKVPYYRKDMLVRAKIQFEGFDNATQPRKPHWESVWPVFALCHNLTPAKAKILKTLHWLSCNAYYFLLHFIVNIFPTACGDFPTSWALPPPPPHFVNEVIRTVNLLVNCTWVPQSFGKNEI